MPTVIRVIILATTVAVSACSTDSAGDYVRTSSVVGDQTLEMDLADCKLQLEDQRAQAQGSVTGLLGLSQWVENCMVAKGYMRR